MKYLMITILAFFSFLHLQGQTIMSVKDVDILDDHTIVVEKEGPYLFDTLIIENIVTLNEKHSKIQYSDEGIYHEAIVNSGRKDMLLVASLVEIPENTLPETVRDAHAKSLHKDWKSERFFVVQTPYESPFYAIDIKNGKEHKRVYYSKLGMYKNPPY